MAVSISGVFIGLGISLWWKDCERLRLNVNFISLLISVFIVRKLVVVI